MDFPPSSQVIAEFSIFADLEGNEYSTFCTSYLSFIESFIGLRRHLCNLGFGQRHHGREFMSIFADPFMNKMFMIAVRLSESPSHILFLPD